MSDRITDTIAAHRPYGLDCKCGEPINSDTGWANHFLAALRANNIEPIQLPSQMVDRSYVADALRSLPMWSIGDAWTCLCEPDLIDFEADSQQVYGEFSVRDARDLAAALLAAAAAAEEGK